MSVARATLAALLLLAPVAARAHDVSYALRGAGDAIVAFHYQDGTPMVGATALVFAPGAEGLPSTTATTDAAGEVRLRATGDGVWRVDVRDEAGHASRARVRFVDGVASLAERAIPNWLAAASLVLNLLLTFRVAVSWRRRAAMPRPAPKGPIAT